MREGRQLIIIRSTVDISHPRQQGNTCASMSAASSLVHNDSINGLAASEVVGDGNPSLSPRLTTGTFAGCDASTCVPLSMGRGFYGHADARASAVLTDNDNDYDANDGDFPDTLGEILGAPFMASPALDFDHAFGAADSNVDFDRTHLLSPPSPLPPSLASPPSSAAAGEPT